MQAYGIEHPRQTIAAAQPGRERRNALRDSKGCRDLQRHRARTAARQECQSATRLCVGYLCLRDLLLAPREV